MSTHRSGPLQGVRVLDLTLALAGPYGTLLLGGLGAEVIRVESPTGGDPARTNPPFVGERGMHFDAMAEGDVSLTSLNRARNKKSITLDLKSPRGYEILLRLVKACDVVIENMSEGVTARLKVDYEHLRSANPRIVYASIKAFGEPSAYPQLKGMDIIVQALSGLMAVTGFAEGPPTRVGIPIADLVTPLYACNGILAALIHRGRTGEGQHVKVSMLDCLASLVAEEHFDVFGNAGYPMRSGNSLDRLLPFGVYPTSDGHVAIVAFSAEWLKGLLEAIGQPHLMDDPRFSSRGPRMKNAAALNAVIERWTRERSSAEVQHELLTKRGVPCAPVRTPQEVLHDPRLHESGAVMRLDHPRLAGIEAIGMGVPIHFSETPVRLDEPAMDLGAANEQIYRGLLGISEDELASLREARVI
jgi:formyl-CoA transferase